MAYAKPQYLRDTDWLFRHLNDPELRIGDLPGPPHSPEGMAGGKTAGML